MCSSDLVAIPATLLAAAPLAAQVFQASGYATISMAGLGNTTSVAGDSRIPILTKDVSYDPGSGQLHLRATGHRGVVRQLDIELRSTRAGARYDFGPSSGASLRVRLDQGNVLNAESGRGYITVSSLDAQRITGTYEGTFSHGAVPIVLRGRFESSLGHARDGGVAAPTGHDGGVASTTPRDGGTVSSGRGTGAAAPSGHHSGNTVTPGRGTGTTTPSGRH